MHTTLAMSQRRFTKCKGFPFGSLQLASVCWKNHLQSYKQFNGVVNQVFEYWLVTNECLIEAVD
jgi:hypothetical protein